MELEIKLAECNILSLLSAEVVSGKDPNAANSYKKPDAVKVADLTRFAP